MTDQKAKTCEMTNDIPIFDHPYPMNPLKIGTVPEDADMTFTLTEVGDALRVKGTLHHKGTPEANLALVVPEIPTGKNVYIKLDGEPSPIFIPVGISQAYGDKVNALFIGERYGDNYRCCVSHTDAYQVGDTVPNPFAD
jgi:hypothetical protein